MKKLMLIFVLMGFTGCATSSVQTGPTYLDWETGKQKYDAKVVLADTGLFTPSTADTLMMECLPPAPFTGTGRMHVPESFVEGEDLEGEELLAESRCRVQAKAHDYQTGSASSFIAPVIGSVAWYYGMKKMGEGVGKSGAQNTNTTDSNNTDNSKDFSSNDNYNQPKFDIDNDPEINIDIGGCD